ncbi:MULTISPECIES: aminodeoxychorismate synthase component I [unclassified Mycobacterium]|uniref:aminodeoxychorismate synthase component I n=1 Tax=unclassified Mycobacterium TaxID=2642494 RepID=UPI00073FE7F6|nr:MULTISPECIES: aminodeoxychorismate synthase component I [unclassified Mycobacterium]KUH86187.1 aminodeoxychorismate synthase component I [Mycobacterium sp. IS-1556]KUH86891.1 aminodeoxychorismate synthase component I [Mycobacterium sp. GA-0227b]KUH92168.1 aminodeoxychorismate synthase component I [Mycobacterium sp. GA-1999]
MRIDLLGDLGGAPAVLRAVAYAAAERGLAAPAALIGDWFGSGAVIAPTVDVSPVEASRVFDVAPGGSGDAVGGGWFGYLSYPDAAADGNGPRVPEAAGGWSDCVLRQDRDGRWWFESLTGAAIPDWVVDALRVPAEPRPARVAWGGADREAHRRGVLACLDAIAAGEVYQACVCTQFRGRLDGPSIDFFVDAVERTSPARAAYLGGDWGAVASLSPELFLCRRGDHVASSPIKGTLPLSADPAALRASAKDVAENIMIVDLVRNDLGRVADVGTVTVPELLSVRPAPGVWHLVSTVSARVDVGVPMSAVLDATFPPASVTGTPKTRARQLLTGWEPVRRGVYCGTVGLASPVAGCELNVAIRTVEFNASGNAVLGVGGGITADSDPGREWEECLHKAAPITGSRARTQDRVVELTP